ncbi:MAG TPA: hypothetical protein VFK59_05285 [Actinomycetota bacterium]|nr:hypothetical protein [Actinomycetota bacterium]
MTSNSEPTLERIARRVPVPEPAYERMLRRRDRKRRNQRIAAGVVGIAVFVAAIWIVTAGLPIDQSQTAVGPAGQGTGPAETGPAQPTTVAPDTAWDGLGIPPEGTALSSPVEGQPIGRDSDYLYYLVVYADGRVLSWNALRSGGGDYVLERRLTPEGVDLVRSGAITAEDLATPPVFGRVPASAWADAEARPYAPPRYSVCFVISRPDREEVPSATDVVRAMDLLPAPANALLRGADPDPLHPGCVVVTTQDARVFSSILSEEGLETGVDGVAAEGTLGVTPGSWAGGWLLRGAERVLGEPLGVNLRLLWPDGQWHDQYKA